MSDNFSLGKVKKCQIWNYDQEPIGGLRLDSIH